MARAADALLGLGPAGVLVKGGHLESGRADDLFADGRVTEWIRGERVDTPNTHGTGCVLSAAIASGLADGLGVLAAVRAGKAFVTEAIRHSLAIGGGIGPVDPGWRSRSGASGR
jgi:hydroxymethylpyrimidine/phosphomethylpyrimidine kinase